MKPSPANPDGIHNNKEGLSKIYKCVKSKYLDDRPSPVASLGVLVTRCEAVWFVEYLWHKEECDGSVTWQLKHCRVAPKFAAPDFPAGLMVATLHLQSLEDRQGHIGLSKFMLWANHHKAAPPQGFRWLTQYVERLAVKHGLPITPVGLRPVEPQKPLLTLQDAVIVGQGHRSLVVRLAPDDDFVVKISSTANTNREHNMHMKAVYSKCQHLRKAVPNLRGVVEGAGEGLSFIGLQLFCPGTISKAHVLSDSSKTTYINQARNLCKFIAIGIFLHSLHVLQPNQSICFAWS
ncbi:hypothetical protein ABBQ38_015192 [Trebouxia sp. C0009 RCD-2024]